MKICFIANVNSIHARRWIEPLITQGHKVYILNYRRGARPISGASEFIDLSSWVQPPKLRFLLWGGWIRRYASHIKPHILHAHQIQAAGWLGALAGFHPFVVSAWGSDILVEPTKSIFRRKLFEIVLRKADYLTAPSPFMVDVVQQFDYPRDKVHLIPWGIDTSVFFPVDPGREELTFALGIKPEAPVLLCPRRISPICNIETIIAALPKLIQSYPKLQLALIRFNPDPAYLKQLENQIAILNLGQHIIWIPAQSSPEKMAEIYRSADIVLSIPSSEGYGASVYEALATGIPTVISDLPVFENELIHEVHTLKVPVKNAEQTSLAILRLLQDSKLRQNLVTNGLQASAERSVISRIERVEALYQQIYNQYYPEKNAR